MQSHHRTQRALIATGAIITWVALLAVGGAILVRHEFTPGPSGSPPAEFIRQASLTLSKSSPSLLVFIHPKCPCTRATLHEIERLQSDAPTPFALFAIFVVPEGVPESWARGATWDIASRIPGARAVIDSGASIAAQFDAKTSGEVLLFDQSARLLFHGGVTPSRAHEGDSAGRASILALLAGHAAPGATPIFGCALAEPLGPGAPLAGADQ